EHVHERPEIRNHERENHRHPDQQRVLDPALRVLVRPEAAAEREHEGDEGEPVENRVLGARAEEAGERHSSILPITQPAAKAEPITAARTRAASAQHENISTAYLVV